MQHDLCEQGSTRLATRWAALVLATTCFLATAILGLAPAPPAGAHDELISSDPAESSVVEALPSRAVLTLSGTVRKVRAVTVTGPDGDVTNGRATFTGSEVRQNLWAGPEGEYVLAYDVVSADGHQVTGEVHFEVGAISGPTDDGSRPTAEQSAGDGLGGPGVAVAVVLLVAGAGGLVVLRRRRLG
jgi:copper resistance protein C